MYLDVDKKKDSFKIGVTIIQSQIKAEVNALVDTGASISCISPRLVDRLQLVKQRMATPMYVRLADGNFGKPNPVCEIVELEVMIEGKKTKLHCYLVEIGHGCIIGLD